MRAIVLEKFGGLDSLVYRDIPEPEPKAGHVVIQIKAFGLNHAEIYFRKGAWGQVAEIAGPALFLCSEDSSFVNGATLFVDGGWTAGKGY